MPKENRLDGQGTRAMGPYSQAVARGRVPLCSGQVRSTRRRGQMVGAGDGQKGEERAMRKRRACSPARGIGSGCREDDCLPREQGTTSRK